jgi:hypothetical protein
MFMIRTLESATDANCLQSLLTSTTVKRLSPSGSDVDKGATVATPTCQREVERNGSAELRQRAPLLKVAQDFCLYIMFDFDPPSVVESGELLPLLAALLVFKKVVVSDASLANANFDQQRGTATFPPKILTAMVVDER